MGFKATHGAFRGMHRQYLAYRYGPRDQPRARPGRRLTDHRRRRLVEHIADLMREAREAGAPSPFALEGAARAGLRAGLCLQGWRWHEADAAAVDVTLRALALTGAERPTWQQGQPEWTQAGVIAPWRERCAWCGRAIEDDRLAKYCSATCRKASRDHFYNRRKSLERMAEADAARAVVQSR